MELLWDKLKKKKRKDTLISLALIFLSLVIYTSGMFFGKKEIELSIVIILFSGALLIVAWYFITIFRINRGYYGNNETECREAIKEIN